MFRSNLSIFLPVRIVKKKDKNRSNVRLHVIIEDRYRFNEDLIIRYRVKHDLRIFKDLLEIAVNSN